MSRYLGPRLKVMRALGVELPGLSRKRIDARPYPPGQHGQRRAAARKSDFGKQLAEKQKLHYHYGVSERQLRRVFAEARRSRTPTGAKLIELLERRLDNVAFRAGFAPTIPAARQLILHRHMRLNGRTVNIPSIRLRAGDVLGLRPASRRHVSVIDAGKGPTLELPDWIQREEGADEARLARLPGETDVPFELALQQVIEYYTTRL
jgi:small subunit ribosomal protein S4